MSEYIDPAATPAHDRWVQDGRCPAIDWAKTWCNGDRDHAGDHWAPHLEADGRTTFLRWARSDSPG